MAAIFTGNKIKDKSHDLNYLQYKQDASSK